MRSAAKRAGQKLYLCPLRVCSLLVCFVVHSTQDLALQLHAMPHCWYRLLHKKRRQAVSASQEVIATPCAGQVLCGHWSDLDMIPDNVHL